MLTAVRERPIIFSAPMIRALLDGRKTMTRRLFKLPRGMRWYGGPGELGGEATGDFCDDPGAGWYHVSEWSCPFGAVGDRLWVRETFAPRRDVDPVAEPDKARHYALYRANGSSLDEPHWHPYGERWTPSIFMPRWASRIALVITGVKVERLDEIDSEDAKAEGVWPISHPVPPPHVGPILDYVTPFRDLWESINGPGSWDANPWVWALSFRVLPPSESRP